MNTNGMGKYMVELVKKDIDLRSFIERESNCSLSQAGRTTWKGPCPIHKESAPSFFVTKEDDGVWLYHCFGCGAGGTVIDFCIEMYSIPNAYDAALFAAEKEGIKCDYSIVARAQMDAKVQRDEQYTADMAHLVVSENCRKLLRVCQGDEETMAWVASTFKAMNKLLDNPESVASAFEGFKQETYRRLAAVNAVR